MSMLSSTTAGLRYSYLNIYRTCIQV